MANPLISAVAPTKEGKTRGSGASTAKNRRPWTSVRVTSQARPVPIAAAVIETAVARPRERSKGRTVSSFQRIAGRSEPCWMFCTTT